MTLNIRLAEPADLPAWVNMRCKLCPDEDPAALALEARTMRDWEMPCVAYVAENGLGELAGFIEVGVRSVAEGCPTVPTAYIEGIWVEPHYRNSNIGRLLLGAAEKWAIENGHTYIGSDAHLDNAESQAWHRAVGFSEIDRLVVFAKPLV